MASGFDILITGHSVPIWKHCKSFLNDVLQSKFGCTATISGMVSEDHQAIIQMKTPEKRFEALVSGVMVSVYKADLTNFAVDAVVNAANEHLQHGGGIALALSNAGGSQIQRDSDDYVRKFGGLKTGEAVDMSAGNLPCKKIIHAVGPRLTNQSLSDFPQAPKLLESAVFNSLKRAEECCLQSIALPAISSGLFGYPLPQCADTIVRTVRNFCQVFPITYLKKILLVNNDDVTVNEMETACKRVFSGNPASRSAGNKTAKTDHNSTHTVHLGRVRLTLKLGQIEEQQTDVIVNTADKDDWRGGQISRAILTKAGPNMEEELTNASVANRRIITTGPHRLHCAEVYHTLCVPKSSDKAAQILSDAVKECLWMAAKNLRQSITFPAIGTGGLHFTKEEVAQIMTDAVLQFAKAYSKQMEVYFVIYPSNGDTFKAFEEKLRSLQQEMFNPQFTNVTELRDDAMGASTAKISLSGPSEELRREAHAWLSDILLNSPVTRIVQNNFITHFGKEEQLQLTKMIRQSNISIKQVLKQGKASLHLSGTSAVTVAVVCLEVENMLCKVQRDFLEEEWMLLFVYTNMSPCFKMCAVPKHKSHFSTTAFQHVGLEIVKVESVENPTLSKIFDLKKQQLGSSITQRMLQLIPAHFCVMVSHIGFQAEFAPPDEPAQGQGIYFASTVSTAMDTWRQPFSDYVYFVEAEVLTGTSVPGNPDLILPPPLGADPLVRYDSVSGGHNISVIFTGYQALPVYIITCKKTQHIHKTAF